MSKILFKKIYNDDGFYEIKFSVESNKIIANTNIYITNKKMNNLVMNLEEIINFNSKKFYWETTKMNSKKYAEGVSIDLTVENTGHIKCKIKMDFDKKQNYGCYFEINDIEFTDLEKLNNELKYMNEANIDYIASN